MAHGLLPKPLKPQKLRTLMTTLELIGDPGGHAITGVWSGATKE